MTNLALGEVRRDAVLLQVAHAAMPECVHPTTRDAELVAKWTEHLPNHVPGGERGTVPGLEHASRSARSEVLPDQPGCVRINPHVSVSLATFRRYFFP